MEVDLPSGSNQVAKRPVTEVYLDSLNVISIVEDRTDTLDLDKSFPRTVDLENLSSRLSAIRAQDSLRTVALYADKRVEYGKVVEILDIAAKQNIKMVLATQVASK